ncbi:MAG: hypothetical protein ACI4NM_10835 [Bullifex sp.]
MNDFGYVIKRNDTDYIVMVDLDDYGSGYNVVPKKADPYNLYNLEDVIAYSKANPDMVYAKHPLEEKMKLIREKENLEAWLSEHDYIGTKIATGRATVEEYAGKIALMNEKANRISEIDALLATA